MSFPIDSVLTTSEPATSRGVNASELVSIGMTMNEK
jgi:hypothetical protein